MKHKKPRARAREHEAALPDRRRCAGARARRRIFIRGVAGVFLTVSLAARSQSAERIARVGYLTGIAGNPKSLSISSFIDRLRELGYAEGRNLVIAAKQATTTIPIVMAAVGDPVRSGLVASLARPGGNMTGNSILEFDLALKRLELVKEVIPSASRVGFLTVRGTQLASAEEADAPAVADAAASLGMQVHRFDIGAANELASTLDAMAKERTDAPIVRLDAPLAVHYGDIARLAIRHRIPTWGGAKQFVEAGGLFSYGVNVDTYRHAAVYVDKILRGAKPAELPIEQPTLYMLAINVKTANALGLTIPKSVLLRADEVIQ